MEAWNIRTWRKLNYDDLIKIRRKRQRHAPCFSTGGYELYLYIENPSASPTPFRSVCRYNLRFLVDRRWELAFALFDKIWFTMRSIYSFLAIACMIYSVQAISPLSIKGNKFFNAEGQQVYFKGNFCSLHSYWHQGVAYQRSPEDPLVNTTQCQLDAALMKTLGANTIRCKFLHVEV